MTAALIIIFIAGYALIALEQSTRINKAAVALITAGLCWTIYIFSDSDHLVNEQLHGHLAETSGILFFLLGAMTIVELIDAHRGFDLFTSWITARSKQRILWIICLITFFLSPVLDNLTTTIVMISVMKKMIKNPNDRLKFASMIVIASNAGGVWSPIGDVTTTMLWIGNQLTASSIVLKLFLPALACITIPLLIVSPGVIGDIAKAEITTVPFSKQERKEARIVLILGVAALLFVPVFKVITQLPPFMCMLISLAIVWIVTEIMHYKRVDKESVSIVTALTRIDTPSILFFLGILLSVNVLQSTGILASIADGLSLKTANVNLVAIVLGLVSAVVDNVPLVAAAQGMFDMNQFPTDHYLWEMLAFTTGTGGSILIIGSAAGIVAMGMEKISFMWYVRRISYLALIGFVSGVFVYMLQEAIFN
jgi:Na+/H+ antiporter NhaD/arsenite permease-like protein